MQECHLETVSFTVSFFPFMDFIESEREVKASTALHRGDLVFLMRAERMTLQKHFIDKCSLSLPSQIIFSTLNIVSINIF